MAAPSEWDRLVNSKWPADSNLIPTEQEAITGVKRLWRKAMGHSWPGKVKVTSGNRYTWLRGTTIYVNPDRSTAARLRRGWPDIIHLMAHYIHRRKFPDQRPHHYTELEIEREMTDYAIANGFHTGALKRERKERPERDIVVERHARAAAREKAWQQKLKRAERALARAAKDRQYYERRYPERVMP